LCLEAKDQAKEKTFGLHKFDTYWDSRKLVLQLLPSLIRPTMKSATYLLSEDWLQSEKLRVVKETSGKSWVSTNDILTSWFFNISDCTSGWIAFNFRNRVPGLTDMNAGPYEGQVPYWPEEFKTPLHIRQSLKSFKTAREDTPGYLENFTGHFTGITNWASFYQPVNIAGSQVKCHFPTMDCAGINTWAMMVIFKVNPETLGICVFSRDADVMRRVDNSPAVKPFVTPI